MAKARKPAITGIARPQGIVDDLFGPLGKKAVRRVTKLAENAALAERKTEKAFAKYQRTGSRWNNFSERNARELLGEEIIARKTGKSLKQAREMIRNTPAGDGYRRMMRDTDKARAEARKVVDARQAARKARRAAARTPKKK
jgi:hypothetical protein